MNKFIKNNLNRTKIVFFILVSIGTLSLVFALQSGNTKVSKLTSIPYKQEAAASPSATPTNKPSTVVNLIKTSPTPSPTQSPLTDHSQSQQVSATPTPAPNPTTTPTTYQINVSINGSSNYSVSVNEGANQCDVLSKSLEQGKISSLNMRFDPNYSSNAVYQINGQGSENSVWWVFKVNGTSPSQGCSHIKANNGDNVLWEYKGS